MGKSTRHGRRRRLSLSLSPPLLFLSFIFHVSFFILHSAGRDSSAGRWQVNGWFGQRGVRSGEMLLGGRRD